MAPTPLLLLWEAAASLDAVVNAVNRSRLVYAEREAVLQAFERRPHTSR